MNTLLGVGICMAAGLLFNRIVKKIGLPNVTGYLVAGLLIGPCCLRILDKECVESMSVLSTVALGFIAFSIGGEFKLSHIRQIGKSVITITFLQALMATLLVDVVLIIAGFPLPVCLTLGAVATATAPAATLMVVRQYKARGPVTSILLPVVALDDAIGLMVFSISLAVAKVLVAGTALSVQSMLVEPLIEIVGSLAVGGALGLILTFCMRFFHSKANRLMVALASVLLGAALADLLGLSSLLLCMSIGAIMANFYNDCDGLLASTDEWTPALFMLFFVLSGAELDLTIVPTVGLMGVLYIVVRAAGKYFGAWLGSTLEHRDTNIRKYLGLTLLPQAGVAIGMAQIVIRALPEYGTHIQAVVLCATLVYELVGPLITKAALTKAGEITRG